MPTVIPQRGVAQRYRSAQAADDAECSAAMILPPSHSYIDNTVPSIEAAHAAGADVVEIDLRSTACRSYLNSAFWFRSRTAILASRIAWWRTSTVIRQVHSSVSHSLAVPPLC